MLMVITFRVDRINAAAIGSAAVNVNAIHIGAICPTKLGVSMLKRNAALAVAVALLPLALSGAAFAGARNSRDIWVGDSSFSGAFGTIRNSANGSSWLRCELYSGGSFFCDAYDGSKYKSCSGSDTWIRRTLESMSSEDDLYMSFSGGTCNYISLSKASNNEPKR